MYLFRNVELNDEHWEQVLNTFDTPLKSFSMSAYDMLIKRGYDRAVAQTAQQFISNLIIKFPNLDDLEVAELANSTVAIVKEIRSGLAANN